jgi:hypothetical protein
VNCKMLLRPYTPQTILFHDSQILLTKLTNYIWLMLCLSRLSTLLMWSVDIKQETRQKWFPLKKKTSFVFFRCGFIIAIVCMFFFGQSSNAQDKWPPETFVKKSPFQNMINKINKERRRSMNAICSFSLLSVGILAKIIFFTAI